MPPAPFEYGQRSRRAFGVQVNAPVMVGLAVLIGVCVTIWAVWDQGQQIRQSTAETRANEIVGPACPPVLHGAFTSPLRPINTFDFNGLTFGHRYGAAECSVIAGKAKLFGTSYVNLCQFSSPAVVSVTNGKTTSNWEPGVGREASVFVDHGQARCVMASPQFARWKQQVTETNAVGRPAYAAKPGVP